MEEKWRFKNGDHVVNSHTEERGVVLDCWPVEFRLKGGSPILEEIREKTRIYEVRQENGRIFVSYEEHLEPFRRSSR